jgi:hypothetical protein
MEMLIDHFTVLLRSIFRVKETGADQSGQCIETLVTLDMGLIDGEVWHDPPEALLEPEVTRG